MGQRANYVLVDPNGYSLFYSHWAANTLPRDLFWGPEHAIPYIQRQRPCDHDDWLDDKWAEGGAVVDPQQRVFLLFGGEDIRHEPPLRQAYLQLLGRVWNGWTIRWAWEGIVDLAEYVGVERAVVLSTDEDNLNWSKKPTLAGEWTESVCSVCWRDGSITIHPMAWMADSLLKYGKDLLKVLRELGRQNKLVVNEVPSGGLHLRESDQRLDYWLASDEADIKLRVEQRWPGWQTEWHQDAFQRHEEWAPGLSFVVPEQTDLLDRLEQMLDHEDTKDPVESFLEVGEILKGEGRNVEVADSRALRHDAQDIPTLERKRILQKALGELRALQ